MAWGNAPPPLAMPSPRRLSNSSGSSSGSSRSSSPILSALDSSAALILVHDDPEDNTPFDFDSDNEDDDHSPQFDVRRASVPPLGPSLVFLYLLSPYLKLGAMFLPHTELPLKCGIPSLLAFAILAAFARQIWYMLARYMRATDLEDIFLDAFARGRGKERRRSVLRNIVRGCTGGLRVLLATIYLRESVHVLLPLLPNNSTTLAQLGLTVLLALMVFPLSFAQSLASKRAVYTTWISIATYVAWLGCVIYAYYHGISLVDSGWLRMGAFWQGIVAIAFAFTSSSTLSLYSSLRGFNQPITTAKLPRTRSFKLLSVLSVAVAVILTLPLIFFSANPNVPATFSSAPPLVSVAIPILNATTLLLGIPALVISTPSLPIPERVRHSTIIPISKILLAIFVTLLALAPARVSAVLTDVLLLSAVTSTYFLPALLHVTAHFFKRPLAIVMPQIPGTPAPRANDVSNSPRTGPDELLLRKERALQKRQFRRRIIWDLGVWLLLFGGGAGFVAAVGRVAGRW
ncbi:hypothetical protein Hypma_000972 [Hypsizygus marmoreus]|uniref:Uncharacterized protein n=1 Tax=Hypsizygus marmoreus TaxID=39966 RepID=A0A369JBV7_HYPMA|nr:hypothetical protein Hypma_000972 [Hypsizygus marmoreus]